MNSQKKIQLEPNRILMLNKIIKGVIAVSLFFSLIFFIGLDKHHFYYSYLFSDYLAVFLLKVTLYLIH